MTISKPTSSRSIDQKYPFAGNLPESCGFREGFYYDDRRVVLELLARGRLNVRSYITHRFAWSDASEAYELLKSWTKSALGMILDWTIPA